MSDDQRNVEQADAQRARGRDDQAALERELRREAGEGAGVVGDMGQDRNVSGSSTWETLSGSQRPNDEENRGEVF
jgi:hypothetical protein